jgi:hypothetical protein
VIRLLAPVTAAQGGQKESWTILPLAGADGACPSHLADAIWTFQQFWKAKREFQNIDGVVDPGGHTLRKLDQLVQTLRSEAKASHHLQWYWPGDSTPGNGIDFGHWSGIVTTWRPAGKFVERRQFPVEEKTGPPPPGTPV